MSPQSISPETRQRLGKLRDLLLEQHKLLLDRERAAYEKVSGAIPGPGAFLNLVLSDPHFAWLRQISTLVVEIDEALSRRSQADQPAADSLLAAARELMNPRPQGTDFQMQYDRAVQESPDVVILQCRMEQLLSDSPERTSEQIDVDRIAEVNYLDDPAGTVEVTFKDGSVKRYDSSKDPEILSSLNHWTPPTA